MQQIVECVPNFSEGRRPEIVAAIAAAVAQDTAVRVLRSEMDPDHNRSVITFIGDPEAVLEGAFRGCEKATELIDLNRHQGVHPRIGATDVIPFIPIAGVSMQTCIDIAIRLGQRIARLLDIPVYLYGEAAADAGRRDLSRLRRGGFEALRTGIQTDPQRHPDFGRGIVHPTAGAVATGARGVLIAFNVFLESRNADLARAIARRIRERDGGLPGVKALGWYVESKDKAQVSMNLTDPARTDIVAVYDFIRSESAKAGVRVGSGELIGLAPLEPVMNALIAHVPFVEMAADRILEYHLFHALATALPART